MTEGHKACGDFRDYLMRTFPIQKTPALVASVGPRPENLGVVTSKL